jgi:hypothetical protein
MPMRLKGTGASASEAVLEFLVRYNPPLFQAPNLLTVSNLL